MAITGLIRAPPLLGEAARGAHQDLKRYPFMLKRTNYFENFPLWAASNQSYFETFLPWAAPNQSKTPSSASLSATAQAKA
jgi:hypothetical protein